MCRHHHTCHSWGLPNKVRWQDISMQVHHLGTLPYQDYPWMPAKKLKKKKKASLASASVFFMGRLLNPFQWILEIVSIMMIIIHSGEWAKLTVSVRYTAHGSDSQNPNEFKFQKLSPNPGEKNHNTLIIFVKVLSTKTVAQNGNSDTNCNHRLQNSS